MANLIIGCGYLGQRVAALWQNQGKRVIALTRDRAEELRALGIEPIVADVLAPPLHLPQAETVLYAVGWDRKAGQSFRDVYVAGLRNVLEALPTPGKFIYISSTSVYGQTDGRWVDETSPTGPLEENGRVVLEAERLLRTYMPGSIILRFAGIYGPGRMIRQQAIARGEPIHGDFDKLINLIHVDDGARIVLAAEERGGAGETFLVADGAPVPRRAFYSYMAELLHAPPPRFVETQPPTERDRTNRRISNRKMRQELGVSLHYPDYRSGLAASLA